MLCVLFEVFGRTFEHFHALISPKTDIIIGENRFKKKKKGVMDKAAEHDVKPILIHIS